MTLASVEEDTLKKAAVALRAMRARLRELEAERHEPIAIVGMGCRFPGNVDSPEGFWRLLDAGADAVVEVPKQRWPVEDFYSADPEAPLKSYSRHMGYVSDVDQFDARLFRISPREAEGMDPQQRLLLEVTWEALEDAFMLPAALVGSQTGVFMGITAGDYGQLAQSIDSHSLTGNVTSIAVGRISYTFGFKGPCYPIDTACSSSLVALHAGAQSLRARECNVALVGGVHLILSPIATIGFSKLRALSPDGKCKTFDRGADGYVRGEGCGVLVLKRLRDALAAGDRIHALIRGSAINQDGRSSGLTAPNGPSQQDVIRAALRQARLAPADVAYVEAHGTGTALGDPIEVQALDAVYRQGRRTDEPLLVGSVKTNVGHLELAAGTASLIKVVLALKHGRIPKHLHFNEPNPNVPWEDLLVSVTREALAWRRGLTARRAGVSGFGFSGTNAHVVLEEAPEQLPLPAKERSQHLFVLSGATPEVLRKQALRHATHLAQHPDQQLGDVCRSAATARTHFEHRLAIVVPDVTDLAHALHEYASVGRASDVLFGSRSRTEAKLAFVCGGHSRQIVRYGSELCRDLEPVREVWARALVALDTLGEAAIAAELRGEPGCELSPDAARGAALISQCAVAALWRSFGVNPEIVLGYGLGEYAAACIAGELSLEDALALLSCRSRCSAELAPGLATLAVCAKLESVEVELSAGAAHVLARSDADVVVALPSGNVEALCARLDARGIASERLPQSAFGGLPLLARAAAYEAALADLTLNAPECPWLSSDGTVHQAQGNISAWRERSTKPLDLGASVRALEQFGVYALLDLSGNQGLTSALRRNSARLDPLASGDAAEWLGVLRTAGMLFVRGHKLDWSTIVEPFSAAHADLPTYAFEHQRYWLTGSVEQKLQEAIGTRESSAVLGEPVRLSDGRTHLLTTLSVERQPYLKDHLVYGEVVVPGAFYVSGMLAAAAALRPGPVELGNLVFQEVLSIDGQVALDTVLVKQASGELGFEVMSAAEQSHDDTEVRWRKHAFALLLAPDREPTLSTRDIATIQARCQDQALSVEALDSAQVAAVWRGPSFQWTRQLWRGHHEALLRFEAPASRDTFRGGYSPQLLDSLWDCLLGALPEDVLRGAQGPFLPFAVRRMRMHRPAVGRFWGHGTLKEVSPEQVVGDLVVLDEQGQCLLEVEGIMLRAAPRSRLGSQAAPKAYAIEWRRADLVPEAEALSPAGVWLVLVASDARALQLEQGLVQRGVRVLRVEAGQRYERRSPTHFVLDGADRSEFARLLADLEREQSYPSGIIDARALNSFGGADPTDPLRYQRRLCGGALSLAQALVATPSRDRSAKPVRLVVLTQGACAVTIDDVLAPEHATLSGWCRSLAAEHPELSVLHLDLQAASEPDFAAVADEALHGRGTREVEVALRAGVRHVARLAPATDPQRSASPVTVTATASYLVTGGTGALGLRVARWLVERGARHLILLSRRGLPAEARATIDELRTLGANVRVMAADVANRRDMDRVFAVLDSELPPLSGVVHAAGVLDDGAVPLQTWERFESVLAPKVAGTLILDELTRARQLDFFVLFSSVSALVGARGQSNYAAANAFMDTLAHARRQAGLPAVSIAWGAWLGAGMASSRSATSHSSDGIGVVDPDAALQALTGALAYERPYLALASIDWRRVLGSIERTKVPALFEAWLHLARDEQREKVQELSELLLRTEESEHPRLCLEFVKQQVRLALGLEPSAELPADRLFTELGMDSLLAVDLRNMLARGAGTSIEPTIAFTHPTCSALADELYERWSASRSRASHSPTAPAAPGGDVAPAQVPALVSARAGSALWFPYRVRRRAPRLRLLCLPYILGSASVFASWQERLPRDIEVCAFELPGHWTRSGELPAHQVTPLVDELLLASRELTDAPLALFGYSFGSLLAFELCRRLRDEIGVSPAHLFVASLHAPHLPAGAGRVQGLTDAQLLKHFQNVYGPAARALAEDEESRGHFARNARADISALENYVHTEAAPLSCPVTVLGAEDDPLETLQDMRAWAQHTSGPFRFHSFKGGHLFVQSEVARVLRLVALALETQEHVAEEVP